MSTLTGAEVWAAALNDASFVEQMPEGPMRNAVRPFIEHSPEALSLYLDKPLTLQALADSKVAFLRYCLENDFLDAIASVLGMGIGMLAGVVQGVIETLVEMLEDIPGFLKLHGVTEEQVMLSSKVGLNASNQVLYKAGTLTIAEVLRTQPGIILKNDNS